MREYRQKRKARTGEVIIQGRFVKVIEDESNVA
jgi:hypothetical protein